MSINKALLAFFLTFIFYNISAQSIQKTPEKDALAYIEAYSKWDVDKMKKFYADSIHFHDPTAVEAFDAKYNVKGKDKVAKLFKNIFQNSLPEHISFKVNNYFSSGSFVVINTTFNLILPKSWYGDKANGKIFVSVPAVTILRFSKGKIISHKDYFDYDSYKKQISFQLKNKD